MECPSIRQIAALPYRIEGSARDRSVRALPVTSHSNGRRAIPRRNPAMGTRLRESAARDVGEARMIGASEFKAAARSTGMLAASPHTQR